MAYNDTIPATRPYIGNAHLEMMRYDDDLNFIDRVVVLDTMLGSMRDIWGSINFTIGTTNGYRMLIGGYEDDLKYGTRVHAHKIHINGSYTHVPVYAPPPRFFNNVDVSGDRLLVTGADGFMVLDTNFQSVVDHKFLSDYDRHPLTYSGVGGTAIRGIIAEGEHYLFSNTGHRDLMVFGLAVQKWSAEGEMLGQRWVHGQPEAYRDRDEKIYGVLGSPASLYDGEGTIYTAYMLNGIHEDPDYPVRWAISAIDTGLNVKWTKVIPADHGATFHAITFSPDSSRILALGKRGGTSHTVAGEFYTYLLDTAAGAISSVGPLALVEDATFLYPSPANTVVRLDDTEQAALIRTLHFFSLGDGRRYERAVGPGGTAAVDDLAPGAYVAYGYDVDGEPLLRQRLTIVR